MPGIEPSKAVPMKSPTPNRIALPTTARSRLPTPLGLSLIGPLEPIMTLFATTPSADISEAAIREEIAKRPYEVWHPDAEGPTPKFATWFDALTHQVKWNRELPGHVARRRLN